MPDQQINPDGDVIKNAQEASHTKGACVPEWDYVLVATTPLSPTTEMGDFN